MERLALTTVLAGLALSLGASAQTTVRTNVYLGGQQATPVEEIALSADGQTVAHTTGAKIPGGLFVYRHALHHGEMIHSNLFGGVHQPVLSGDGRFVCFVTSDDGLGPVDTNSFPDVYLTDLETGTSELISGGVGGAPANGSAYYVDISDDGRFVAFGSTASNLGPSVPNPFSNAFVRDRVTGQTTMVSIGPTGQGANWYVLYVNISGDGRFVAWASEATNLVPDDVNGEIDVFVHDRFMNITELVSVGIGGWQGNGECFMSSLSYDGRFVAFSTRSNNLVSGDTNDDLDVYVRDRLLGHTVLASEQATAPNWWPQMSGDGRWVSYRGHQQVVPPAFPSVHVRDLITGEVTIESTTLAGLPALTLFAPGISADGRWIAFRSLSPNVVPNDTNGVDDGFLHDRLASPGYVFCRGDEAQASCPCGNPSPSAANAGCLNSLGFGAALAGSGAGSLGGDTVVLQASGMPNSTALLFQGTTPSAGTFFGDGVRCVSGTIVRIATRTIVGGAMQFPAAGDPSLSVRGNVSSPSTRAYQVWYRNAAPFCTPEPFNLSNGWRIDWGI
jgi:Tol biopolymer transport system component